jgi:glycosyltransferase involved in cell wall biosynthesis
MNHFHQMLVSHELGGAGLIALQLASFLKGRGQESHVWIPGVGPAQYKASSMGLAAHFYDSKSIFSSSRIRAATGNWRVGRELHCHSPGLIHIHSPFFYRALRLGFKLSHLKSIAHVHIDEDDNALRWAFKKPPDLIITCARFLVDHVRHTLPEAYQTRQRIVALSNPVDIHRFHAGDQITAKHRIGVPIDVPLVLMLANLAPHKGQETAIRATAALNKTGVKVVLWLAGTERGGEEKYTMQLHKLCSELGMENHVRFLGHRDDAPDLLRAADIFLLPSSREGLPLSILEAQATKVPVLAAPTAGVPEVVINGKTGFLIAAQDTSSYAYYITLLLRNAELRHRMVQQAHEVIVKEYSWNAYSERMWNLYQDLITQN